MQTKITPRETILNLLDLGFVKLDKHRSNI
jgi:hypothetical protein